MRLQNKTGHILTPVTFLFTDSTNPENLTNDHISQEVVSFKEPYKNHITHSWKGKSFVSEDSF